MKKSVLFISYDGMLEPLAQSQALAYVEKLAQHYDMHLLSFEKPQDWANEQEREHIHARTTQAGIHWHPLRYRKKPRALATSLDVLTGIFVCWRLIRTYNIELLHARGFIPSLISHYVSKITNVKWLLDMRGFWADERIDGGLLSKDSRTYTIAKYLEDVFNQSTHHIVILTHAGKEELQTYPSYQVKKLPITVIPTCADLTRFCVQGDYHTKPFVFGHVGNVGTWYLFDETLSCFTLLKQRRSDAKLVIITRDNHDDIRAKLRAFHIDEADVTLRSAAHAEVPALMRGMTVGSAIIKPVYSKIASAPTKLAEYLGCGVPVLGNVGVGDMQHILEQERTGVALHDFSDKDKQRAIDALLELVEEDGLQQRCRTVAEKYFSLDEGSTRYQQVYQRLIG